MKIKLLKIKFAIQHKTISEWSHLPGSILIHARFSTTEITIAQLPLKKDKVTVEVLIFGREKPEREGRLGISGEQIFL